MPAAELYEVVLARAVAAVAEVFERQGEPTLARLLRVAKVSVDSWGPDEYGESHHRAFLQVPVDLYARFETEISLVEEPIVAKLRTALRFRRNDVLEALIIGPLLDPPMTGQESLPANAADHIWDPGMLRLFISHVAEHKVEVAELKEYLRVLGISGFVAHEDIAPTHEWQDEIDLALRTAQAAAALLTPDYHESPWTDQEVGIAMARGITVIPVDLRVTPYGFMGKYQALRGDLDHPEALADAIADILTKRPETVAAMREGLVTALQLANTYKRAKKVTNLLVAVPRDFTGDQLTRIRQALAENNQVSDATRVPELLALIVG